MATQINALLQLKLYAERNNLPSSTLILKDTYSAKAYSKESLKNLLQKDSERITSLIISTAILIVILSIIIILVMMCMFFCSNSHTNSKWMKKVKKKKPAVLSLTVLSALANLYIISLTSAAFHYWHQVHNDPNFLIYDFDEKRNFAPLLTALIIDILCFVVWVILIVVSSICRCLGQNYLFALSLTVLSPLFRIIAHSPYIAIAYLNDGDHASSIFIYYTILSYIFFAVAWSFFHWLEQYNSEEKLGLITMSCLGMAPLLLASGGELGERDTESVSMKKNCCRGISCCCLVSIIFLLVTIVLLLGLAVITVCYFVIIPINKAISDAPMRVLSIYQSGGFVIGSFIVYKVLKYFYSKSKDKNKDKENKKDDEKE